MSKPNENTESEQLFEAYLAENEYDDWEFEPAIGDQPNRPDYRLRHQSAVVLLEVKEMHKKRPIPKGAAFVDPYRATRDKIGEARRKFQRLKNHCCSLVLCNISDWEVRLDPLEVFGAMLGDLGFTMDFDPEAGRIVPGSEQNAYLGRGRMIRG